jgi:hypothetical protein
MKFGVAMCGHCHDEYDGHVEESNFIPCPRCTQNNPVIRVSPSITGRCEICGKPLEANGHLWWHDQFIECRNGAKK